MLRSILLSLFVIGCGASQASEDGFSSGLEVGCDSVAQCELLEKEAKRRYQDCLDPPGLPCDEARADNVRALNLLIRRRSLERAATANQRAAQEKKQRQAVAKKEEEERIEQASAELAAWKARQEARQEEERRIQHAAEEAQRSKRLAPYRALTPAGRQNLLTSCIHLGHEPGDVRRTCGELVLDLVAVSTGDQETTRLLAFGEAALATETTPPKLPSKVPPSAPPVNSSQPESSGGSGRLICCDGTMSPSCGCSRSSRRGCCSHHQGVCGCDE